MKRTNVQPVYMVLDILVAAGALYLSLFFYYDKAIPAKTLSDLVMVLPVTASTLLFIGFVAGCYESVLNYAGIAEMLRQLLGVSVTYLFLMLLRFAGLLNFSDAVLALGMMFTFLLTGGIRISGRLLRWYTVKICRRNHKRTLIVGAGASAAMLIKRLREASWKDLYPVAVLDDDPHKLGMRICGVKVIGSTDEIVPIAGAYRAELILIAIPSADAATVKKLYERANHTGLPIKMLGNIVDIQDFMQGNQHALKEISIEDLLFRSSVQPDMSKVSQCVRDKTVLITGGAGSIGSELCRQVLKYGCKKLIIFDIHENGLFELSEELKKSFSPLRYALTIGSVRDEQRIDFIFKKYRPQLVFHAAAHKHVPMMESNACEAIKNNVWGTKTLIDACKKYHIAKFILISTDKAVNPTSVMGATKRLAELLVQAESDSGTEMAAVRFGNVLGSNGSVVPTFKRQIQNGGPVTVTDPEMRRYFMTIVEAVSLVLQAAAQARGGEIFVLDMGKQIRIYDLARDLIRLSGYEPERDIKIEFCGVRPGEKLYEELTLDREKVDKTSHEKIFVVQFEGINQIRLHSNLARMKSLISGRYQEEEARRFLFDTVNGIMLEENAAATSSTVS